MTDIVERLRSANGRMGVRDSNDYGMTITVAEANAAADEIERLRGALEALVMACELPGDHCEVEQALPAARAALGGGNP